MRIKIGILANQIQQRVFGHCTKNPFNHMPITSKPVVNSINKRFNWNPLWTHLYTHKILVNIDFSLYNYVVSDMLRICRLKQFNEERKQVLAGWSTEIIAPFRIQAFVLHYIIKCIMSHGGRSHVLSTRVMVISRVDNTISYHPSCYVKIVGI